MSYELRNVRYLNTAAFVRGGMSTLEDNQQMFIINSRPTLISLNPNKTKLAVFDISPKGMKKAVF